MNKRRFFIAQSIIIIAFAMNTEANVIFRAASKETELAIANFGISPSQ